MELKDRVESFRVKRKEKAEASRKHIASKRRKMDELVDELLQHLHHRGRDVFFWLRCHVGKGLSERQKAIKSGNIGMVTWDVLEEQPTQINHWNKSKSDQQLVFRGSLGER